MQTGRTQAETEKGEANTGDVSVCAGGVCMYVCVVRWVGLSVSHVVSACSCCLLSLARGLPLIAIRGLILLARMRPTRGGKRGSGKAKARAKEVIKAKVKAASKKAVAVKVEKKGVEEKKQEKQVDESSVASPPDTKKRRQLCRRSSDEKVDRALQDRLAHLPEPVWRNKINAAGLTLPVYTKRLMKGLHTDNKRLSTKHWADMFTEFGLSDNASDSLAEPTEQGEIDRELLNAISVAQSGNPVGTPSSQLERYLERCRTLSRQELYGLLHAVMEGPMLARAVAVRCQAAVLKYLARTLRL